MEWYWLFLLINLGVPAAVVAYAFSHEKTANTPKSLRNKSGV